MTTGGAAPSCRWSCRSGSAWPRSCWGCYSPYIPYIGAFLGGGLAVIITLGNGGFATAGVMLVVVIAANAITRLRSRGTLARVAERAQPTVRRILG